MLRLIPFRLHKLLLQIPTIHIRISFKSNVLLSNLLRIHSHVYHSTTVYTPYPQRMHTCSVCDACMHAHLLRIQPSTSEFLSDPTTHIATPPHPNPSPPQFPRMPFHYQPHPIPTAHAYMQCLQIHAYMHTKAHARRQCLQMHACIHMHTCMQG